MSPGTPSVPGLIADGSRLRKEFRAVSPTGPFQTAIAGGTRPAGAFRAPAGQARPSGHRAGHGGRHVSGPLRVPSPPRSTHPASSPTRRAATSCRARSRARSPRVFAQRGPDPRRPTRRSSRSVPPRATGPSARSPPGRLTSLVRHHRLGRRHRRERGERGAHRRRRRPPGGDAVPARRQRRDRARGRRRSTSPCSPCRPSSTGCCAARWPRSAGRPQTREQIAAFLGDGQLAEQFSQHGRPVGVLVRLDARARHEVRLPLVVRRRARRSPSTP